jgi:hypothetical protein
VLKTENWQPSLCGKPKSLKMNLGSKSPVHLQTVASASRPLVVIAKDTARPLPRVRSSKGIAPEQSSPALGRTTDLARAQKQAASDADTSSSMDR